MRKNKLLSLLLSCSVALTGIPAAGSAAGTTRTADTQSAESDGTILTRTMVSEKNGLRHYAYVDENGNTVTLESGEKRTSARKKASSLPSSYDSRETGRVTSIKDQGNTGSCWAFAAIKALESSAIDKGLSSLDTTDLSENHLAWYSFHGETDTSSTIYGDTNVEIFTNEDTYNQGGDAAQAIATFANWWGAAAEEDAPFDSSKTGPQNMTNAMKAADSSLRYKSVFRLKEANCYDNADITNIKQAVIDYGDVDVSHFYPETKSDEDRMIYKSGDEYSMYQSRYDYQYANHSVSIVGWDDNYSAFKSSPPANGAWLIANSWGENGDFTNKGYYWVSYYDTSLSQYYTFEADTTDQYDTNYQYDGAGYCVGPGYTSDTSCANVFTNTGSDPQEIKAAGIYTLTDNQAYEIYIYRNVTGSTPDTGEYVKAATTGGTINYAGYHTITLKEPVTVAPGERFSVVVNYKTSGSAVYIPLEGDREAATTSVDGWTTVEYKTFSSQAGQSFIYSNDSWIDTTNFKYSSFRFPSRTTNYNNVCLKAFASTITTKEYEDEQNDYTPSDSSISDVMSGKDTSDSSSDDSSDDDGYVGIIVTPAVSSLTIGKGEKVTISYSLSSSDAVTFKSNALDIASVSNNGTVTGKKTGKAVITLTTSSGGKAAVTVTVKKAPSKIAAYVSKSTIKKGKTVKIKTALSSGSASYKLTYSSSDKKVASVSSKGVITAKKKGTAKITVTTFNKKKSVIRITVK